MAGILTGFDIVMYLGQDWEIFCRSQMVRALARNLEGHCKILLVEQPICPFVGLAKHRARLEDWMRGKKGLRQLAPNLFVYTPWVFLHYQLADMARVVKPFNDRLLRRLLKSQLERLGFSDRLVVFANHPLELPYLGLLDESTVVYDCFDEYAEVPQLSQGARQRISQDEKALLAKADVVFTTAKALYNAKRVHNERTFWVPNGVDYDHFVKALAEETPLAARMQRMGRPVVGYLGTIHEYLDIDLLIYAATQKPQWSFVLIGPEEQPEFSRSPLFQSFRALPNVHLLGWIDYEEIPSHFKAFDVCIIPYKLTKFNEYVYPNKLNEYLATGRPVVSTRMPEVESFGDSVYLAEDRDDFVAGLARVMAEDNPERVEQRLAIARKNSYEYRTRMMVEVLDQVVARPNHSIGAVRPWLSSGTLASTDGATDKWIVVKKNGLVEGMTGESEGKCSSFRRGFR